MTYGLLTIIGTAEPSALFWAYFWGAMWGLGGLTFGLTMRYLGMSLGMAVALGYCAVFGTLVPPIYHGEFKEKILETNSGIVILIGIVVCLLGIAIAGMAGMSKEREMDEEQKKNLIKEFNFKKGILVATFSGVFSACFAFALDAATPLANLSKLLYTPEIWSGLPKLCIVLLGGFTSNFIWCVYLNIKNKTGYQYFSRTLRRPAPSRGEEPILENPVDAPSEEMVEHIPSAKRNGGDRVPMLPNYFFSALAGVTWYMQFFFYSMGETQMGKYGFSSWTLHMASIIIFSSLWGIALKEWKGSSGFTKAMLTLGLATLVFSTVIVGYGNFLAKAATP
jgi:L-rhamnose-H+ transport protein